MKSRGLRFALIALGVLIALALVEVALRLGVSSEFHSTVLREFESPGRWVSHPFLPYAGRPNADYELKDFNTGVVEHYVTNSYGFRAHEFPATRGANDYIVLCFGESTTMGYPAPSNDKTWPERLEQKLAARYPTRHIQVFNLGVEMATSAVSVVNLALIGIRLHPDLVIVYHGFNDLSAVGRADFRWDHSHFYRDLAPDAFERSIVRALPQWARKSYLIGFVALLVDNWAGFNELSKVAGRERIEDPDRLKGIGTTLQNLKTLDSIAVGEQSRVLFSTFQFRDGDAADASRFNGELRRFFANNYFAFVDQDLLLPDHDATVNVDECHLTEKGTDLIAQNFYDYVESHHFVD